jgi:hypothetical protein
MNRSSTARRQDACHAENVYSRLKIWLKKGIRNCKQHEQSVRCKTVHCQNWYMYTIEKKRETWEDGEIEGKTSFKTSEYRTGLYHTFPELEEEEEK